MFGRTTICDYVRVWLKCVWYSYINQHRFIPAPWMGCCGLPVKLVYGNGLPILLQTLHVVCCRCSMPKWAAVYVRILCIELYFLCIYIIIYMMYIYLFYPRFVGLSLLWFLSAITCGFCPAGENSADDEAAHKAVTFDLLCRSQQGRPKAPFDIIQKITFNCWVLIQCFCDIDRMQIKRHLFNRILKQIELHLDEIQSTCHSSQAFIFVKRSLVMEPTKFNS